MHDPRLGAAFRAVRIKRGWRQSDVAAIARVSRQSIGRVEAGDIGRIPLDTLERIADRLEIRLTLLARWRGGELDRQLSARHAALSELVAQHLRAAGWTVVPRVSFSIWGERGLVDLIAWHEPTRSLIVIEIKTEVVDVEETVGTLDRKRRLGSQIVADRGWRPRSVSMWLVIADGSTNRRRVAAHSTLLRSVYRVEGRAMRRWVAGPGSSAVAGSVSGLRPLELAQMSRTRALDEASPPASESESRGGIPPRVDRPWWGRLAGVAALQQPSITPRSPSKAHHDVNSAMSSRVSAHS
jgi:transcriptional regulator with XRE-family HTH domain